MSIFKWFSSDGILNNTTCGDFLLKTKAQYFKEEYEKEKIEAEERKLKWTQEIMREINEWDTDKLVDEYIKLRLARISYHNPITAGMGWKYFHEECRFCGLKYISGEHDDCCDNCWDKNKNKTLKELE